MSDIADALTRTIRSAPELATSPGLAYGVAQDATNTPGSDVTQNAQATALASNAYAQDQAVQNTGKAVGHPNLLHQALGWLGGAAHSVNQATGGLAGKAVDALGVPLGQVQEQYRYLHDVEARHGPVPALLEALGIAAAATAGAYYGGSTQAAILSGEAAAEVQSHLFYTDSLARVQNGSQYQGNFNRQTGQYEGPAGNVSIGRDISSAVGLKPGSKPATFFSGAADALGDLVLDPLVAGGKLAAEAKGAEGLAGARALDESGNVARTGGAQFAPLAARYPGTGFYTPEDVDKALNAYPTVRRGMQQLADQTTEELTSNKRWAPMAAQLGPAQTVDQVAQVFKDNIDVARTVSSTLPTSTMVGGLAHNVSQGVQNYEGLWSNAIRSATSFIPTSFDPSTLSLSGREFDPADPSSIRGVYQVARYSMTKNAAEMLAGEYANAAAGDRIGIYRNILTRMFAARGLEEDSPEVKHELDQLLGGSAPGFDAHYGTDSVGRDISQLPATDDQSAVAAAIGLNQSGKLAYPDFNEVTKLTRQAAGDQGGMIGNARAMYGRVDDFVYKDFTQRIFKRLALLSGGFAQRIAMAEAIPAAAREGVLNLVKHQLATTAAKLGYDAATDPEEVGRVGGAVWNLGKGIAKLSGGAGAVLNSPETVNDLTDMVTSLGGHRLPAAVDTATHYSGEVGGAAVKAERDIKAAATLVPTNAWEAPKGQEFGSKFMQFGNDDLHFDQAWAQKLSSVSNDPLHQEAAKAYLSALQDGKTAVEANQAGADAVTEYLRNMDANKLSLYQRSTRPSVPGADPLEDWGKVVMSDLRGATHSPDVLDEAGQIATPGSPHPQLLQNVADGKQTSMDALSSIDKDAKPLRVEGRELIDIPHQGVLERISNFGFSRVLDPIINKLSREPIYANQWLQEYQPFKPLVEAGQLDKGDAIQFAHERAVKNMVPFIHNTLERSQFAELSHNYMPFFFAQQQALARYGRVLVDNPGAFRQLQLATTALHDTAAQAQDPNGNNWLVYPGLGFVTSATMGALGKLGVPVAGSVPVGYSGRVASLNSVFPLGDVAPRFGPVVAIAGHALENLHPELRPAVTQVIGDAENSGGIWSQIVPNTTLKTLVQAFGDTNKRSFAAASMQTIQSLAYQQQQAMDKWTAAGNDPNAPGAPRIVPPDDAGPQEQRDFVNKVKNQTRILFVMKAIMGSVTPTAVQTDLGDLGVQKDLQAAIAKDGVAKGLQNFLGQHPDATPYTVFQSDSPLGSGAVLPSAAAENYYNSNSGYLKKFPYAGVWLLPQVSDPKIDPTIYNEQLEQGLRSKRSPEEFYQQLQIAEGDKQFFGSSATDYTAALKNLTDNNGSASQFRALQQQVLADPKAGDYNRYRVSLETAKVAGGDQTTLTNNWQTYLHQLAQTNPVWYDDFTSNTRANERQLAADQLVSMFSQGNVPPGPQTADLASLVQDYERYQNAVLAGRQDSFAEASRAQLKARWQDYTTQLAAEKPNLAPVITHVFRSL